MAIPMSWMWRDLSLRWVRSPVLADGSVSMDGSFFSEETMPASVFAMLSYFPDLKEEDADALRTAPSELTPVDAIVTVSRKIPGSIGALGSVAAVKGETVGSTASVDLFEE